MRLLGRRPGMTARRLLSRGLERAEIAERNLRQRLGERGKILDYLREPRPPLAPPLVHIDRAVELELDRVQAGRRIAVMLGDEAARIGLVAADRIAESRHGLLDRVGQARRAARAIAVADHDVGPARFVARNAD